MVKRYVSMVKYLRHLKKSKLQRKLVKDMKCQNQSHTIKKKFFENSLSDFIGKPKMVCKALKSLGLPSKRSVCKKTALKVKKATCLETKSTLNLFKNHYSTLADNLLKKLPTPPNKHTFNSVI